MGDKLSRNESDNRGELTDQLVGHGDEVSRRPWLPRTALVLALLGFLAAIGILFAVIVVSGDASDERSGSIANAPTAGTDDEQESESEPESTPEPSAPPVDVAATTDRLSHCINEAEDYGNIDNLTYDCFLGYKKHLPTVYGLRDIGEIKITGLDVVEPEKAKVKASIEIDGNDAGSIDAFYADQVDQFKIVGTEPSDWSKTMMRQDVVRSVENQR